METNNQRGIVILLGMGMIFVLFISRIFVLQVLNKEYQGRAQRNVIKQKEIVPPRGNIYDRNAKIYVSNSPLFDMLITPSSLEIRDTSVLYHYLDIDKPQLVKAVNKARRYSRYKESLFAKHIEPQDYGAMAEQLWDSRGINFKPANKRYYHYPVGANFLGYISEVDSGDIKAYRERNYKIGDMIGKSGLERSYEEYLKGTKGQQIVLKDVHNREVGRYAGGRMDTKSEQGADLLLGIDVELQKLGETLMHNKRGSIVAIEPTSGEILAFVSAPSYDPNQLTGKSSRRNWIGLRRDSLNPLFNRPLQAAYPPGSIFKIAMALAALNEGVIEPETRYHCGGAFWRNGGKPGCRMHVTPLGLRNAIKYSCNSYFAATYMDMLQHEKYGNIYPAYDTWYRYMSAMGVGHKLNVDIPYEKPGLLPSKEFYDNEKRWYGKNRWGATTIISNSIGQGEIMMTPIQMANLAVLVANRGYYVDPHLVRGLREPSLGQWEWLRYERNDSKIERRHFEVVADAMEEVVARGTARRAFIEGLDVCGKTGTVENPHGENHAVFIGFAPKQNPKIAIAAVIENAGGGGSWAAPTASILIEQYLRGKIEYKKFEYNRIYNADFYR